MTSAIHFKHKKHAMAKKGKLESQEYDAVKAFCIVEKTEVV
eukprot:CAMPEP_0201687348 /NCGR_PEP_ID=MMETSP0578-20130828/1456_1 /ASSEMBLY_ACC=CAM_ASM_000663 /TAXON_ID=267565 /ORGANISM="Skeletonema grethea, Strain CCMP 1804" /LENGTH=40 /DNA_ID= /DNA_START= /DNA_END= /DNA_ORIENTATION=